MHTSNNRFANTAATPTILAMKPFVVLCLLGAAIVLPVPTTTAAIDPSAVEVSNNDPAAAYQSGWTRGWKEGYKHAARNKGWIPNPPYPPYPTKWNATWQDGFNDGFVAGRQAAGG